MNMEKGKNFRSHVKKLKSSLLPAIGAVSFTLLVVFLGSFVIAGGGAPALAELHFAGHSILGSRAGSVVPASCESNPPTNHFDGDCPSVVTVGLSPGDPRVSAWITATPDTPRPGDSVTVAWGSTGATSCISSWTRAEVGISGAVVLGAPNICENGYAYVVYCSNVQGFYSKPSADIYVEWANPPCSGPQR